MYTLTDTIVALATPPGEGALGIIRLSGADAIAIADAVFKDKKLSAQPSHTIHFGTIADKSTTIDEVVASIYRSPRSYTGEDIIEFSCHGSDYILQQVINLCIRNGARMARPGEYTLRAFLAGKLDLTQAEAVADLIASHTGTAHHAAMHNLRGGFSEELKDMRAELIKFSALIELELDFSQEDVEFADRTLLYDLVARLTHTTTKLIQSFHLGNAIRNGVSVAIIGKPNAGKSTLLNALLNEERAIVSDIAGTTRDTIEETLNINGILFRLIDTAGIREHTADVIEQIGVSRSKAAMNKADIVVYLFDAATATAAELQKEITQLETQNLKFLLVGNKADKPEAAANIEAMRAITKPILYISAQQQDNVHHLSDALAALVTEGQVQTEGTIITNARHHAALQQVLHSLKDIKGGMDNNLPGDLLALDIRRCLHYLGDITGEVTTEDKLDFIFSKFCIGK